MAMMLKCNFHSSLQSSYLRPLRSLLGLLFLYDHHQFATSGGMMGGDDFSSSYDNHSYDDHRYDDYSYADTSRRISSRASMKAVNEVRPRGCDVTSTFIFIIVTFFMIFLYVCVDGPEDPPQKSVVMLQVGSLNTGRSLQRDLNRIAESADTSTSKGWKFVLQESILSLLHHSNNCVSGYSSVDVKGSLRECEERFNQLTVEERGKFDELTLVNVNNIRKKTATNQNSNGLHNEYIVVTIIVAARVVPELPSVKNSAQLKEALLKLASIPSSNIMGALVLWTPQKEDDSLTEQNLRENYPLMRPL